MFGAGHELTLQRTDDTDSMIRNRQKNTDGSDKTKPGNVNLKKINFVNAHSKFI